MELREREEAGKLQTQRGEQLEKGHSVGRGQTKDRKKLE